MYLYMYSHFVLRYAPVFVSGQEHSIVYAYICDKCL